MFLRVTSTRAAQAAHCGLSRRPVDSRGIDVTPTAHDCCPFDGPRGGRRGRRPSGGGGLRVRQWPGPARLGLISRLGAGRAGRLISRAAGQYHLRCQRNTHASQAGRPFISGALLAGANMAPKRPTARLGTPRPGREPAASRCRYGAMGLRGSASAVLAGRRLPLSLIAVRSLRTAS